MVEQNAYDPGGWAPAPEKSICVYWINKQSERIGDGGLGHNSLRKINIPFDVERPQSSVENILQQLAD